MVTSANSFLVHSSNPDPVSSSIRDATDSILLCYGILLMRYVSFRTPYNVRAIVARCQRKQT
jgi:hypothetical protein